MSASEPEQAKPIHGERRMSIMNEIHDIMSAGEPRMSITKICFTNGKNE